MSWKFPKYPMENGRVPDVDNMNENFLASAQELAGQLNEHNWAKDAFTAAPNATTFFKGDTAFVWHSNFTSRIVLPYPIVSGPGAPNPNAFVVFQERADWREIPGSKLSFSCSSCLGWIHASLQFYDYQPSTTLAQETNFQFAIKVDGAVMSETITGGVEPPQDVRRASSMWVRSEAISLVFPLAPGPHEIAIVIRAAGGIGDPREAWIASNELICLEMRR